MKRTAIRSKEAGGKRVFDALIDKDSVTLEVKNGPTKNTIDLADVLQQIKEAREERDTTEL